MKSIKNRIQTLHKPNLKCIFILHFVIGLYTSLSFGALAYSRFHRGKSPLYDAVLIGISMLFLLLSFTINWILNRDINEYLDAHELPDKYSMYLTITKTVFVIHSILFALGAGTFIKSYFLQ